MTGRAPAAPATPDAAASADPGAVRTLAPDPHAALVPVRRPAPRVAAPVRTVRWVADRARRLGDQAVRTWSRSLQLRVATATVLVTTTVVLVLGIFIIDQVSSGVLSAKKQAAINQANIGRQYAAQVLAPVDPGVVADVADAQQQILDNLTASGGTAGLPTIALVAPQGIGSNTNLPRIPESLRKAVQGGALAVQYAQVPVGGGSTATTDGLIVGEPVAALTDVFELYYLFPLTAEAQTIHLVQRTVLLSGLALVLLVLALTLLVTRQVVRPVRVAARTAGMIAAGDLSQRIPVRRNDDLARLGESFNDMAGSLQRQIRRLEDLSRLQRRFTSDVSHELRTPLTTIRMASEVLHEHRGEFPPAVGRSAELLSTELDRFESLLADLLEISRYDAGVAHLESEPVDLRVVVGSAVDSLQVLAERHGSSVLIVAPDEPVTADVDPRRVERIVRNLVGNALDHGEGRPVEITVAADDDAVAVTVRDHGVGLRPGEAGLVFNRFWRGDTSRSRLTGGTGLGLAISLEDARLHDGWLQAWGERGRGAQFRLTLPRSAGYTLMHSPLALSPDDVDEDDDE